MEKGYTKLQPIAFAVAMGIVWGLGVLILALGALYLNWGALLVHLLSNVYIGLAVSVQGSLIGAAWGFADAFIGGLIFALLYNCMVSCCCRKTKKKKK